MTDFEDPRENNPDVYAFVDIETTGLLPAKDNSILVEIINKNVFGFEEMLELLQSSDEPQKEQDFLDYLRENHDVEWTTFVQVTFRLMWLMNLGKVEKVENGYIVK